MKPQIGDIWEWYPAERLLLVLKYNESLQHYTCLSLADGKLQEYEMLVDMLEEDWEFVA